MNAVKLLSNSLQDNSLLAPEGPPKSRFDRFGPWLVVGLSVAFGLIGLSSETTNVPTDNDSSVHQEMTRFAEQLIRAGHLPFSSWFPFIGLGSPQYLHYQSLGVVLTALLGLIMGANHAFDWTLYLLLALWPLSVYWSARLFGWGRWPAAAAAAMSPLLLSVIGVGYEQQSYMFDGYGVWTQLWAMWTLPLAWAFSYRAISERRYVLPAALFIALTAAFHFLTGYLAFLPIIVWVLLKPSKIFRRFIRGIVVGGGAALLAGWVIVPLIAQGKWASVNELLQGTPDVNSYGAHQVLGWLVTGGIYDDGRFLPIVTILVGVGLVACLFRFWSDERSRALVIIWLFSLVLFFGRPTLGAIIDLLPGHEDLFLRRFIIGVQLSGLLLAGVGTLALAQVAIAIGQRLRPKIGLLFSRHVGIVFTRRIAIALLALLLLAPAWSEVASNDTQNADNISYQTTADATQGAQLNVLITKIKQLGGGRTYAGLDALGNWGLNFEVGDVPVLKYLASQDVDEVGYTLRTASLMTIPEAYFEETNPSDYTLFDVRYMILPPTKAPPVPAHLLLRSGPYLLWEVQQPSGYFQVIDTIGHLRLNRTDIGADSVHFVESPLAGRSVYPVVAFGKTSPIPPRTLDVAGQPGSAPGSVISENVDLEAGKASAEVTTNRTAVVLLKVSYDPGWQVIVDGTRTSTVMIGPALVGVIVTPGQHRVSFQYVGYPDYDWLFGLSLVTLVLLGVGTAILKRRDISDQR